MEKDLSLVINETEYMINFGCKQVRHLNAVTLELKLLLTYEQVCFYCETQNTYKLTCNVRALEIKHELPKLLSLQNNNIEQ